METEDKATMKRIYDDFEPFCKWQSEEEQDRLEVHLKGFKKANLRGMVNKLGNLTITGECPLDGNRWSRFRKEIKLSKACKTNQIRAKLSGGILYVVLPKQTSTASKKSSSSADTVSSSMPSPCLLGQESSRSRLKINTKLAWKVAVLLAVVVGFGAYAYKYYQQVNLS